MGNPSISVVICTYNREKHLVNVLAAISEQSFEKEGFEVIVVDNNSTDSTTNVCQEFKHKHPNIQFIRVLEKKPGLSNARNKGITSARSDIIAFIDDDAMPRKDYVEKIFHYTQLYPDYCYFGGKILPKYEKGSEPPWLSKYLEKIVSKVDMGKKVRRFPNKSYPIGCNMIFRKQVFMKYGYFNPELQKRGDDKYIYYLLRKHHIHPLYCPDIIVDHFIENERVTKESILKIASRNGLEENIRTGGLRSFNGYLKLCDYIFKLAVSFLLAAWHISKPQKGYFLIIVFWASLKGFISGNNNASK